MAKRKSKSSADYWREREEEQRRHNIEEEKAYSKEIERIYRQMMDEIEVQINDFYTRYAAKEGITYAEAKKRVSSLDIKRYAELAKKYVAEKNLSDQANEEMRLYNLTMKVNRLELLKANIGMHLVGSFDELQQFFEEKLTKRTIEIFERQAGILGNTVNDNAKVAHAIVNASFHNATWSDRIWKHQDTLRNELGSLLSTGLIQGRNPRELARTLRKKVKSSEYNANRLMITEMARVQTEAQRRSFEENGFDQYTFHSLGTACPHCLAINGKHFKVKDMQPGLNAAPMHPNCRCSVSAYMERTDFGVSDEEVKLFDEWSETYDDHGLSWKDWKPRKKIANLLHKRKDPMSVHIPPLVIEGIKEYTIDEAHIKQRGHKVNIETISEAIDTALFSVTRWNGQSICYYGESVAVYVDTKRKLITTSFSEEEFDPLIRKAVKICYEYVTGRIY